MNLNIYKIVFVVFITLLALLACSILDGPIEPPPCPIENLMIDGSLFPKGWSQMGEPRLRDAPIPWGVERLGVGFITQENGVAGQVVHRGQNLKHTEDGYSDLVDSWFDSREDETDWYIPPEFNYKNAVADHYRFGCRTHRPSKVKSCQLVGQYGVYLTRFRTDMSPMMTYRDLDRILQTIDNKMAKCVGK